MPNPKHRHTRSRRDSRRSQNWKLERPSLIPCANPDCKRLRPAHAVCPYCGFYGGRLALAPKTKKEKKGEGEQGPQQGGANVG